MASIGDKADFDAEAAAQQLRDAMQGFGTDEASVASILGSHSNGQLQEISTEYTAMFGRKLIEDLEGETKGYFEELCVGLVRPRIEFVAHLVHDALSGAGTTEQIIVDIFGTIEPYSVASLREVYQQEFEKSMEDDITSDLSGYFERFLVSIMSGGRHDNDDGIDYDLAREDAQKLYDAAEGFGTDECAFMSVFMTRSWDQLRQTVASYKEIMEENGDEEKTLFSTIDKEFSGSEQKLLWTLAKCADDPIGYYAEVLRQCMEGIGTSDRRLYYTIVICSEINLAAVRDAYNELYGEDLSERIESEVSSDMGVLLKLLVNGNDF